MLNHSKKIKFDTLHLNNLKILGYFFAILYLNVQLDIFLSTPIFINKDRFYHQSVINELQQLWKINGHFFLFFSQLTHHNRKTNKKCQTILPLQCYPYHLMILDHISYCVKTHAHMRKREDMGKLSGIFLRFAEFL